MAAACVCCVYAMQGCGIMASSDCVEKAVCRGQDGLADDATNADEGSPTAPESGDVAAEDVASEDVATDGDAGLRDVASEDVAIEDVVSEDVVTEVPPPPDGSCNPPYTCAPPVPSGWSGPALLWTAPSGSTAPSCPAEYQSTDLKQGLAGTDLGTCDCTCNLSGETCSMTATFHPDQACASSTCLLPDAGRDVIRVSPPSDGGCTPIPDNLCGSGGSILTTNLTAYAATCAPTVTPTRPTPSFATYSRLCSTTCASSTKPCIIGPTSGFVPTACIFQAGDIACPSTTYVNKSLHYAGVDDSRTCSACSCSDVDGGTCANIGLGTASSMTVYTASDCTGSFWADITLDVCGPYPGGTLVPYPASVSYNPTITSGTCPGVSSAPHAGGSVTPTGATTVCCM